MKKILLIASSLAFFFACSEEKTEANYNRCPKAQQSDVLGTVADIDGNKYDVVKIGDLECFASNLKATKLNDGTPITNITDEGWSQAEEPAFATFNSEENGEVVYNYAAVEKGNLCPEGWTVPTESEWMQIAATYAAVENPEGWDQVPTTIGWDSTSFAAKAAGFRERNGNFYEEGNLGLWWTSTPHNEANAMYVFMKNIGKDSKKYVGLNKSHIGRTAGLNVRCVRKYDANNTFAKPEQAAMDSTDAVSGATQEIKDSVAEAIVDVLVEEAQSK